MQVQQIVAACIVATAAITVLRNQRPEIAVQASVMVGVTVLLFIIPQISAVINLLKSYSEQAGIKPVYFSIMLKITGVAYVVEFGAEICRDAGEGAIASKVELAGKIAIIVMAVPIITSLFELIIKIM